MSEVSLLDIIGPVMVGPSSSHTAGACRIGLFARGLVGGTPERALVELHGSFARTGQGHGTDRAIAGGLLGYQPDDERLREALEHAEAAGTVISFENVKLRGEQHPNTARITVHRGGVTAQLVGASLGAGRIQITQVDGFGVDVSGNYPTLVVAARDVPGVVAHCASCFARAGINLASVRLSRRAKGGDAIHIYECDTAPDDTVLAAVRAFDGVTLARSISRVA